MPVTTSVFGFRCQLAKPSLRSSIVGIFKNLQNEGVHNLKYRQVVIQCHFFKNRPLRRMVKWFKFLKSPNRTNILNEVLAVEEVLAATVEVLPPGEAVGVLRGTPIGVAPKISNHHFLKVQ